MTERKAFKEFFDRGAVVALGDQVAAASPDFDRESFVNAAGAGLERLEMMDRVRQMSNALRAHLPESTPAALEVLTASLPAPLPSCENTTDGYLHWPVGQLIADHAVDHLDPAWETMVELTQRFSSEFAVRPFVRRYPDEVFARLLALTEHPSPHVRRWCAEGIRPRLPWGGHLASLIADPSPALPILERLKDDPERYVGRSVANHLNDIAKDHPDVVLEVCERWSEGADEKRTWVIRHALRSLSKDGHPGALAVLGFRPPTSLSVSLEAAPPVVTLGGKLRLETTLTNGAKRPQKLLVDYRVHYVKSDGRTRPKVFRWKTLALEAGEGTTLGKTLTLRHASIRRLYAGAHRVDVQVNGEVLAETGFELRI